MGGGGLCKSTHSNCMWQLDSGPSLEFNVTWQANRKKHWSEETGVVDCNHDARQGNIYLQTSMVSLVLQSVNIIQLLPVCIWQKQCSLNERDSVLRIDNWKMAQQWSPPMCQKWLEKGSWINLEEFWWRREFAVSKLTGIKNNRNDDRI